MGARALGICAVLILCGALAACAPPAAEDGGPPTASAVLTIRAGEAEVESADGAEAGRGRSGPRSGRHRHRGRRRRDRRAGLVRRVGDPSRTRHRVHGRFTRRAALDPRRAGGRDQLEPCRGRIGRRGCRGRRAVRRRPRGGRPRRRSRLAVRDRLSGDPVSHRRHRRERSRRIEDVLPPRRGRRPRSSRETRLSWNQLMVDEWAEANADLDVEAGFAPRGGALRRRRPVTGAGRRHVLGAAHRHRLGLFGSRLLESARVRARVRRARWSTDSTRTAPRQAGNAARWSTRRRSTR